MYHISYIFIFIIVWIVEFFIEILKEQGDGIKEERDGKMRFY